MRLQRFFCLYDSIYLNSGSIILVIVIISTLLVFAKAQIPQNNEIHFPMRGLYRPVKPLPVDFNDICEIQIKFKDGENELTVKPDQEGKVTIVGLLTTGEVNREKKNASVDSFEAFKQAKCKGGEVFNAKISTLSSKNTYFDMKFFDKLEFSTLSINGISYEFSGNFLSRSRLENGVYIQLEGVLKKLKNGKEIAQTEIKFFRWAYL